MRRQSFSVDDLLSLSSSLFIHPSPLVLSLIQIYCLGLMAEAAAAPSTILSLGLAKKEGRLRGGYKFAPYSCPCPIYLPSSAEGNCSSCNLKAVHAHLFTAYFKIAGIRVKHMVCKLGHDYRRFDSVCLKIADFLFIACDATQLHGRCNAHVRGGVGWIPVNSLQFSSLFLSSLLCILPALLSELWDGSPPPPSPPQGASPEPPKLRTLLPFVYLLLLLSFSLSVWHLSQQQSARGKVSFLFTLLKGKVVLLRLPGVKRLQYAREGLLW